MPVPDFYGVAPVDEESAMAMIREIEGILSFTRVWGALVMMWRHLLKWWPAFQDWRVLKLGLFNWK